MGSLIRSLHVRVRDILILTFIFSGLFFAILFPPLWAPDEPTHWDAALNNYSKLAGIAVDAPSLEKGLSKFVSLNPFGTRVISQLAEIYDGKMKPEVSSTTTYGGSFAYPQVLIAKFLTKNLSLDGATVLARYYLSRIISILLVILPFILQWRSLKCVPLGIPLIISIMLLPLFVQQSSTINADVAFLSLATTLCVFVSSRGELGRLFFWFYICIGYCAATSKSISAPLIIPMTIFGLVLRGQLHEILRNKYFWTSVLLTTVAVITTLGQASLEQTRAERAVTHLQYIKSTPFDALRFFWSNLPPLLDFHSYSVTLLGWFDVPIVPSAKRRLSNIVEFIFAVEIALLLAVSPGLLAIRTQWQQWRGKAIKFMSALFAIAGIYLSGLAIVAAMFIAWTKVGAPGVDGLQMRYFLPHLICLTAVIAQVIQEVFCVSPSGSQAIVGRPYLLINYVALIFLLFLVVFYLGSFLLSIAIRFY
jgi:uncharacterized membrane protein